jgi:hypothetical protein
MSGPSKERVNGDTVAAWKRGEVPILKIALTIEHLLCGKRPR